MPLSPLVLLLLAQTRAPLAGTAEDRDGRPLAGVEIVLAEGQALDGTVPILARATTDARGRYAFAPSGFQRQREQYVPPFLSAYRPGSGLLVSVTSLKPEDAAGFRLSFDPAGRRVFTVHGDGGRPRAGVRLAPLAVRPRQPGFLTVTLPEALMDQMEATTGPDGRAVLTCLAPTTALTAVRLGVPGLGTYTVALAADRVRSEAVALELQPAGRLAGRVRRDDGAPVVGAEVEIWSVGGPSAPLRPIRWEAGPIRTGDDGTFRTPSALLPGAKYRALVRAEGFRRALTEWVSPEAEGSRLRDVVLTPPRTVVGRVVDRQGQPVAGAAVTAGGENVSSVTDAQGNFRLSGLDRAAVLLVIRHKDFRIDGRLLGPGAGEVSAVLARFDEPAARPMPTEACPAPVEERRRLARRVLDPFLVKVLANGEDSPKSWALRSLMVFDPGAALDALDRTTFRQAEHYQSFVRYTVVLALAHQDPDEALAVAESIPEAYRRAEALVAVCANLRADQRGKTREILDRVLTAARAEPEPGLRLWQLGVAAGRLFQLGETERARAVFEEGQSITKGLVGSRSARFVDAFAPRLALVDLPAALALAGGYAHAKDHVLTIGSIASMIAATQPAEAERLVAAIRGTPRSHTATLRTCQNMASVDLSRARRIALAQDSVESRAAALVVAAYGLPSSDRDAAHGLVRQALAESDRNRESADPHRWHYAALLPWVESIDPALVPEFFWRCVADLGVHDDPRVEHARDGVLREALLLARYDRQVASVLFEAAARASTAKDADSATMSPNELLLLAVLDPHRAAQAVEAMGEPRDATAQGANWSRIVLSEQLGRGDRERWDRIWKTFSGLGTFPGARDVL